MAKKETTLLRIPKELRKKLKIKAAKKEITMMELMEELLKDVVWK